MERVATVTGVAKEVVAKGVAKGTTKQVSRIENYTESLN